MGTMAPMSRDRFVWMLRIVWAAQPVVSGAVFASAIDSLSRPLAITMTIGLWMVWTIALAASFIAMPVTLVITRVIAAAAPVAALFAVFAIEDPARHPLAIASGTVATGVAAGIALSAQIGDRFVDGASYGDERRMLLRPSLAVMAGPIMVTWLITVAGAIGAPLLLASQRWVWAGVASVVGLPLSAIGFRALYALAQRWAVFVPAGIVLRDATTLADPVLFRREGIVFVGPALVTTDADDLTAGAGGLALEMRLAASTPLPIKDRTELRRRAITPTDVDAVLFAPSLPGAFLDEAERRGIVVQ